MSSSRRRRMLLAVVVLALVAVLVPVLRGLAVDRQQAWVSGCVASGGWVETLPARRDNPLVVQTGHPTYQCRSAAGVVTSRRD